MSTVIIKYHGNDQILRSLAGIEGQKIEIEVITRRR